MCPPASCSAHTAHRHRETRSAAGARSRRRTYPRGVELDEPVAGGGACYGLRVMLERAVFEHLRAPVSVPALHEDRRHSNAPGWAPPRRHTLTRDGPAVAASSSPSTGVTATTATRAANTRKCPRAISTNKIFSMKLPRNVLDAWGKTLADRKEIPSR
jgi:hypothetical protein